MQTLEQIEVALLEEIDHFQAPDISDPTCYIGIPWSSDRYREEIAKMRECLITPHWCLVRTEETAAAGDHSEENSKRFAAVARDEDYILLFDPEKQIYALGFEHEGIVSTFMYGDAVSTFLAR